VVNLLISFNIVDFMTDKDLDENDHAETIQHFARKKRERSNSTIIITVLAVVIIIVIAVYYLFLQ